MATTINVRGRARDERLPDWAEVHLLAGCKGNNWELVRSRSRQAITAAEASIQRLVSEHPQAVERHSTTQVVQRTWKDGKVTWYTEEAQLIVVFSDFSVLGPWLAGVVSEEIRVSYVDWVLAPQTQETIRRDLGTAAVQEAQQRAEIFAQAAGLSISAVQALADPGLLHPSNSDESYPMGIRGLKAGGRFDAASETIYDLNPEPIETIAEVEASFLAE